MHIRHGITADCTECHTVLNAVDIGAADHGDTFDLVDAVILVGSEQRFYKL